MSDSTEPRYIMVDFSTVEKVMESLHLLDRREAERIWRINQGQFIEGITDDPKLLAGPSRSPSED